MQVFDWDKDEAHRFLGELRIPLEELAYAEEGKRFLTLHCLTFSLSSFLFLCHILRVVNTCT